ncbi:glycosyltransferase family 2 protein [Nitratireductor luteus]|uniref:glycosyltransferase family 2 protein n=1 Tax=Nitratireductor luteus TaxID=2976980 RepID=UPI00223FC150|nr:glycosyltransferase family 2 protein [Nitratireductor luteus]
MSRVAVIIPFYQQEKGILSRALDSIAAQTYDDIEVIVVDDSSPLSPVEEIAARPMTERDRITVIRQSNGGPGKARNTALDAVPSSADYAAFLDSDDRWEPEHIATAVSGLDAGFDLFFADYTWPRGKTTRLKETGLAESGEPIMPGSKVMAFTGDFFESILSSWPVHLSATVIKVATLGHIRFDERLRFSSEDMYYLLQCAGASDRVCYSPQLGVRLDDGLNMFRRQAVGSFEFSRSRLANAYFHRLIEPDVTARGKALRTINRRLLRTNYRDFLRSEAKSLLLQGRLHFALYGEFLKILSGSGTAMRPAPPRASWV